MPLTTLAAVKLKLGIPDANTSQDAVLSAFILQVDARIETYCARTFDEASYTEYPDGYGTRALRLKQKPVTAITSVYIDSTRAFGSDTLLTAGTDYSLINGRLFRIGTVWPTSVENRWGQLYNATVQAVGVIKVVYTAGYADIPADLTMAADQLIAIEYRQRKFGVPMQSESLEDYSYSRDAASVGTSGMPANIAAILAPYVRRRI